MTTGNRKIETSPTTSSKTFRVRQNSNSRPPQRRWICPTWNGANQHSIRITTVSCIDHFLWTRMTGFKFKLPINIQSSRRRDALRWRDDVTERESFVFLVTLGFILFFLPVPLAFPIKKKVDSIIYLLALPPEKLINFGVPRQTCLAFVRHAKRLGLDGATRRGRHPLNDRLSCYSNFRNRFYHSRYWWSQSRKYPTIFMARSNSSWY